MPINTKQCLDIFILAHVCYCIYIGSRMALVSVCPSGAACPSGIADVDPEDISNTQTESQARGNIYLSAYLYIDVIYIYMCLYV